MEFGLVTQLLLAALFLLFFGSNLKGALDWIGKKIYELRMTWNIPGPKALPIIGSMHLVKGGINGYADFVLCESAKVIERGGTLMRVWLGPKVRISLFDSESIKVLTNSTVEVVKARDYEKFEAWLGNGLVTSDGGADWHRNRKLLTPAFHFNKLEEYATVMDHRARSLVQHLHKLTDGQEHNVYFSIKYSALDIIAETAMGIELNALEDADQAYVKAVDTYLSILVKQAINPFYENRWFMKLSGYGRQKAEAVAVLKGMSANVIRKRVQILEQGLVEEKNKRDFLDILLQAYQKGEMSFEEMRENVDTFLFGVFPDHWSFKPERFLDGHEYPPNAYIPFSAGLRNCIGQKFAMREIRTVLAHLVWNFRFATDRHMLDNKPIIKIVLTPSLGVPVKLEARRH